MLMDQILSYRVPVWAIASATFAAGLALVSIALVGSHVSVRPQHIAWLIAVMAVIGVAAWGTSFLSSGGKARGAPNDNARRDELIDAELAKVVAVIKSRLAHDERYAQMLGEVQSQLAKRPSADELTAIVDLIIAENHKAKESAANAVRELTKSHATITKLQQSLDEAVAETMKDPLTGIGNRRSFDLALDETIVTASASGRPMTLVFCDLDHFKRVNDEYGHAMGDQVLKLTAQALSSAVRGTDIVCRFGGEEFAIILPNTALKEALMVAERMRSQLLSKTLAVRGTNKTVGTISASFGVAELGKGDDARWLVDRTDGALYRAKALGRNCVVS